MESALQLDFVEKRAEMRQTLVMRTAKLVTEHGEYVCVVRDVSRSGTKLKFFHQPPPDEFAFLELANGSIYPIQNVWSAEDTAGYRFTTHIGINEFITEPGKHPGRAIRLKIRLNARISVEGEPVRGRLINISQQGACVETVRALPVRQRVKVEANGLPDRIGHVCWRKGNTHGNVFQDGFTLEELAARVFALQPFPETIGDRVEEATRRLA